MPNREQVEKMSDEEIVKLTLASQDYFLYLINRYKTKLFHFIRRTTNIGAEDAEDLLQDIFLKIYLNLNDFDNDFRFSSWAYSIARNHIISNHRKLKSRPEGHSVVLEDDGAQKLIADFDIDRQVDESLVREKVLRILDKMDKKYREVLVLKYLEEKSYEEISDIIKRPIGTVGSLVNRAKREFKQALDKQNIKF